MIDPVDQNHATNVFRVKESTTPLLQKKALFALGKRRETSSGAEYTIYTVKDLGDKSFKVDAKVGVYAVPKSLDEKHGDLTDKDANAEAFAEIGDSAIQAAEKVAPEKEKAAKTDKLDVIAIPGRGDCFFQSVAYSILADDKFLTALGDPAPAPWDDDGLKQLRESATKEARTPEHLMDTSAKWIDALRRRVSKNATVSMYQHAKEMMLQTLDRKEYIRLMHAATAAKADDDHSPGDVYKDGEDWYVVNGDDPPEQLNFTPYEAVWKGSKTEKEWRREEEADLKLKENDPDGQGEITGQKLFQTNCTTFKKFKKFITTSNYWADERAVEVLAKELEINILVVIAGLGVNASTGMGESAKTIILQRDGQHYNSMYKRGTNTFVFKTNGSIVSELVTKSGGAAIAPESDDELDPAKPTDSEPGEGDKSETDMTESVKPAEPETTDKPDAKESDAKEPEAKEPEAKASDAIESDAEPPETQTPAETKPNTEAKESDDEVMPAAPKEVTPKPSGGRKRSKKLKFAPANTSRKLVVHTDAPF
jgi:hypothetical protein